MRKRKGMMNHPVTLREFKQHHQSIQDAIGVFDEIYTILTGILPSNTTSAKDPFDDIDPDGNFGGLYHKDTSGLSLGLTLDNLWIPRYGIGEQSELPIASFSIYHEEPFSSFLGEIFVVYQANTWSLAVDIRSDETAFDYFRRRHRFKPNEKRKITHAYALRLIRSCAIFYTTLLDD